MVELMVSTTLGGFIMVGVLSCFLMLGRMGSNIQNYTEMEAQGRQALELFSREVRMAYDINHTTLSPSSVTLYIPDTSSSRTGTGTGAYNVTYTFDSTNKLFTRTGPPINDPAGATATTTLMKNVQQIGTTNFFCYYRYVNTNYVTGFVANTASSYREVQQIEVSFLVDRQTTSVPTASNKVLSARFILRNK